MTELRDHYGRYFKYLRLSITDVCNFRCSYCLPNGYKKPNDKNSLLNREEIRNLASAFADLGVQKIRLTGGEPTLRKDIVDICHDLSEIKGIDTIALTTNGYRLPELIAPLKKAGLNSLNVSIDSLLPENFKKITGHDKLQIILEGLALAKSLKIESIKINVVLLKNLNDHELPKFLDFVKSNQINLRFIELMRTGQNFQYFEDHHLSTDVIKSYLHDLGWTQLEKRQMNSGPAVEFFHPNSQGKIGLIAPYSKNFCENCNRLRVSSRGGLKLCLFGESQASLRPWLQSASQKNELKGQIFLNLKLKTASHSLQDLKFGDTYNLSSIGG